jgi:hypothetical protein
LTDKRFAEWTKGLEPKEAMISVYEHIRDIPYAIIPELRDPVKGPAGILEKGCGSCIPKHFLLAAMFGRLGIPVKFATYPFKWGDPAINYPPDIRNMVKELPTTYHLACKARIGAAWRLVDATWDPPLKRANFPVNEDWDGESDTNNAVTPFEEVLHDSLDDRLRYESSRKTLYTEKEKAAYERFIPALNAWLKTLRSLKNSP